MIVETYIQTVEAVQVPPKCSIYKDIREITDNIAERNEVAAWCGGIVADDAIVFSGRIAYPTDWIVKHSHVYTIYSNASFEARFKRQETEQAQPVIQNNHYYAGNSGASPVRGSIIIEETNF